jgi:nucleotide-binding universal stress UspA family protein
MKQIVIATDGSGSAVDAVAFGLELAREQNASVVFVHVVPLYEVFPGDVFAMAAPQPHELSEADREPLEKATAAAESSGVRATTQLLAGDPANEIVAYADSVDADVIVVGSRGRGAIAGAFLGSVSRGVLREARRPVLVVPCAAQREHASPVERRRS